MIYLGNQYTALEKYKKEATCWLGIKIKGRKTISNPSGHFCAESTCLLCNSNAKKRSRVDQNYRDLFSDQIIHEIVVAKPSRLVEIFSALLSNYIALPGKDADDFKSESKKIFVKSGYTNWFLKERWNYQLAKLINQHTCTYCNRQYIFIYKKSKGTGMVPQFDHWFSKSDFPLLALSFFNLIPSCGICNSIKSQNAMDLGKHLHPYVDTNISSSYRFSYFLKSTTTSNIIFKNNNLINNRSLDTIEALELEKIYEGHSSKELQDLIDLRYKYSDNYLEILLNKTFGELQMTDKEKYRLIFGIELNEENYHKRVLSKFKKDIIDELLNTNSK
jgi:hypothetical protein